MTVPSVVGRGERLRSAAIPIQLACTGCDWVQPDDGPLHLACPMAVPGDDIDHVLARAIDPARLAFPVDEVANPFIAYRSLLYGYHVTQAAGRGDAEIVALIERLDRGVAAVDGRGFVVTPWLRSEELGAALDLQPSGGIWVKDETGNVSGSHKARHLFGTLLELELSGGRAADRPLAIASCGNAALAAAVVARAGGRALQVFIPPDAPLSVVARLETLGASVEICERRDGEPGDPTYRRLREAVADGAIAFTCQGNLNGLAIEGGMTLGWEIVAALRRAGQRLDHIVIQVGGGALASAVVQAFEEARELGAFPELPRIHTVQTSGAHPLARAHGRLAAELGPRHAPHVVAAAARSAARHRSAYMWPWESEPRSIATGILDDETYDWLAVTSGMLATGGLPVIVDEATLRDANRIARVATGIDVDHTGSAGLAGVLELRRRGVIGSIESVAVIFTGVRREPPANGVQP